MLRTDSCMSSQIIAQEIITGMSNQGDSADVVNLDISKVFDSWQYRLLIKKMAAFQEHPLEFLRNRIFWENRVTISRIKLFQRAVCFRALCLDFLADHLTSDFYHAHFDEGEGEPLPSSGQITGLCVIINLVFTPSVNARFAANNARGMLHFMKSSLTRGSNSKP